MLPWMRVPIAIEGGASVPLADVRGLHPQLAAAMQSGESHVIRVHIIQASAPEGPQLCSAWRHPAAQHRASEAKPTACMMQIVSSKTTSLSRASGTVLDLPLVAAHRAAGFAQLFPVQAAAWRQLAGGHSQAHDLCISAPTGSGKTLAYALPVLSALIGCASSRITSLYYFTQKCLRRFPQALLRKSANLLCPSDMLVAFSVVDVLSQWPCCAALLWLQPHCPVQAAFLCCAHGQCYKLQGAERHGKGAGGAPDARSGAAGVPGVCAAVPCRRPACCAGGRQGDPGGQQFADDAPGYDTVAPSRCTLPQTNGKLVHQMHQGATAPTALPAAPCPSRAP